MLNAHGNYIHAPGKFVAAVGVNDMVVVETRRCTADHDARSTRRTSAKS